jgi:hypothetical protein
MPRVANLAADAVSDPPGRASTMPALVGVHDEEAFEAFGEIGDLTGPAQVALAWWTGLRGDLVLARELTYDPRVWGEFQWAISHLAGRSLASKVLYAVDSPGQIAFMRFVPEVAASSQVFETYLTSATFLTLVRVDDTTWRVWGLGPALLPRRTSSAAELQFEGRANGGIERPWCCPPASQSPARPKNTPASGTTTHCLAGRFDPL